MKTFRELINLVESAQSGRPELRTWGNRATGETHYSIDGVEVEKDQYYQAWRADQKAKGNPDIKEQGVAEAISRKDLISRLQKDLPRIDDPENKDAEPVKWTGPKKGDYGHTGYQGHGMPTDRAEQARIRADKKKGVAEDSEAHRLGSQAAARGRPYSTNPYPAGSKNHLEWSQAHNSIRARRAQEVDEQATPEAVAKINSLFSK